MDLGSDSFAIRYDPDRITVKAILATIGELGYRPERVSQPAEQEPEVESRSSAIPEPVAGALRSANLDGRLLLLDFYAEWCGPCKVLDATVLSDPEVQTALTQIEFLKVDTDEHIEAAKHYEVVGMPMLLILDAEGVVLFQHVGMIESAELVAEIARHTQSGN